MTSAQSSGRPSMRPNSLFLWLLAFWAFVGLAASIFEAQKHFEFIWYGIAGFLVVVGLLDLVLLYSVPKLQAERRCPARLAVGVAQDIDLKIVNRAWHPVHFRVFDGIPASMEAPQLPWTGKAPAKGFAKVTYQVKPLTRGPEKISDVHLLQRSLFGLWSRFVKAAAKNEVRVFPNYEPVIRFSLLAMRNQVDQMGIVALNRPGVSKEFHQLRDFQEGDVMAQIDWKATSRRLSLISREYRQQRDQTIIFAVDCGRRMRVIDGNLTQFDHCLNAILLLSYIATRQGDSVGVLSFGGTNRWLPPLKGSHFMPVLLNHLYDYQTTPEPTDFSEAVERLMARQKRRALVVFLTNLRSEDSSQILTPLRILKKKHVVLLASLRETEVTAKLHAKISNLDQALTYAATHLYLEERGQLFNQLRQQGILTLDESSERLPIALANAYLEIKKEGKL